MAYQFSAGILQRGQNYFGNQTVLEKRVFNVNDCENLTLCYLPPPTFNTDLSGSSQDGGRMRIGDPNLPPNSKLILDFFYRDGSDFRKTRYAVSANSTEPDAMLDDSTQFYAISPIQGYTV